MRIEGSEVRIAKQLPLISKQLVLIVFRCKALDFRDVFCIAKLIEGKILCFCHPQFPKVELHAGQKKDWNDSGGQRPAQNTNMLIS